MTKSTFHRGRDQLHIQEETFQLTSQQVHQVVSRALSDICLDMHLTRRSQVPGNACEKLKLQPCI